MLPSPTLDIVHVIAPGRFGGAESVVAGLARGLAGRGHRVRVIALHGLDPADRCESFAGLAAAGVELRELRFPARSYLQERRALGGELMGGTSVAHSHGYHADLVTAFAAGDRGRPAVSTAHGFTGRGLKNRIYEWASRRAVRGFGAVIAVSAPLEVTLKKAGIPDDRLHLLPNAFEPVADALPRSAARSALGLPAEGPVVGWIGRLTAEKGPDVFLNAVARFDVPARASIVGEGAMGDELQAWAASHLSPEQVHWHGGLQQASRYFAAFDVVVMSSWTEGTPIVLLEAMSAGVPVVVTNVGGIPDVVGPAEAVLVPPGDPAAIAAGVRRCLIDRAGTEERIRSARARVAERFSIGPWLDRHEAIYRCVSCR
ncbi:MAG: glycosyltransferase family 4 protein [Gemmatimonadales bacterium]